MENLSILHKGYQTEDGSIEIVDEDRLCFLVKSSSKGAFGLRTISKELLSEFVGYFRRHPDASAMDAREDLTGKSMIDKFEYGYYATLTKLAKLIVDPSSDLITFADRPVLVVDQSSYSSYLTALQTKPFLLLAGISGTGKSRIVREFAFKSCPEYLQDDDHTTPGNYLMVEVKPNWHDSSELLGYYSNLANNGKGAYKFTPFIEFLVKALKYPDVPFFVCLDEMNLAPVEQYFAEFLSILETRKKVGDHVATSKLIEAKYMAQLPDWQGGDLTLPDNVFIIGTVNMDDTTHQFSRKVIDRAMTIEMNGGDLMSMFGGSKDMDYLPAEEQWALDQFQPRYVTADEALEAHPDVAESIKRDLTTKLDAINLVLENTPFQVSYRVLNELTIYMVVLLENGKSYDDALAEAVDQILLMKILPRIEGDQDLLMVGNESRINQLNQFAISTTTKDKLTEMQLRLERQEFTRFWP